MKIGVIGATLARKLADNGHDVKLANSKGPDHLRDLACDLGAAPVGSERAVRDVDVVVLSIPFARYSDLVSPFNYVAAEVVVIEPSNYDPFREGAITEVGKGKRESIWVSEQTSSPIV
jgi:predicted dinucleotide-binding enzyme